MFRLKNDKVFMVDCDETLVIHNYPPEKLEETVAIENNGIGRRVLIHKTHVELVKKFKFLGYRVVVWSLTGEEWAHKIMELCGLTGYVDVTMSKPMFYLDDQPSENFMGTRIWKEDR